MANINGNAVLDVLELLLTAEIYNNSNNLDEDDLPPRIRKRYWDAKDKKVHRPMKVIESDIKAIYGLDNAKDIMSSLPFVNFDEFGSIYTLTVLDLGTKWFAKKTSRTASTITPSSRSTTRITATSMSTTRKCAPGTRPRNRAGNGLTA